MMLAIDIKSRGQRLIFKSYSRIQRYSDAAIETSIKPSGFLSCNPDMLKLMPLLYVFDFQAFPCLVM
jgi:hypothetical protein